MKYYHNPRCSKSRQGLEILNKERIFPEIINYINNPITFEGLKLIISKLDIVPESLIRKNEPIYKENFKNKSLSSIDCIQAMIDYPKLMERPILEIDDKAIIGRPPERLLELIKENKN